MKALVVDTNVPIVANGHSPQAGPQCVVACIDALEALMTHGIIVIDNGMHILDEYSGNLSYSGQPGPGDAFFKWVWINQANPDRCERVPIHWKPGTNTEFQEFPVDPQLAAFDRSDRKFVAVARASTRGPDILNASDTDWWDFREALAAHGVQIQFVCPELMQQR